MEYRCPKCGHIWYAICQKCLSMNIKNNLLTGVRCLRCGSYKMNNVCSLCNTVVKVLTNFSECLISTASIRARGQSENECKELALLKEWLQKPECVSEREAFEQIYGDIKESTPRIIEEIVKRADSIDIFDDIYYSLVIDPAKKLLLNDKEQALSEYITAYNAIKKKFIKQKPPKKISNLEKVILSNCKIVSGELRFTPNLREVSKKTFKNYSFLIKNADINNGVLSIKESAFRDCINLSRLSLPSTLKRIEYRAFLNCRMLQSLAIPASVGYLGSSLFTGCNRLTSVDFAKYEGKFLSNPLGGNVFCDYGGTCLELKSTQFDPSNKKYVSIDGVIFDKALKTLIAYPPGKTDEQYTIADSVESIEASAFYKCLNLKKVVFGKNVKSVGQNAFGYCVELGEVVFNDTLKKLGEGAFMDARKLTKIELPASCTNIGALAFARCESLQSASLPPALEVLNRGVFRECTELTAVKMPPSLKYIWDLAFSECRALTFLQVPQSISFLQWDSFLNCNENLQIKEMSSERLYKVDEYLSIKKHIK